MHSVTTEQNNSHYFKFFKRPHEYYQKIGTQSILEEYNLGLGLSRKENGISN